MTCPRLPLDDFPCADKSTCHHPHLTHIVSTLSKRVFPYNRSGSQEHPRKAQHGNVCTPLCGTLPCGYLINKIVQPSQVVAHAMSHPQQTIWPPELEVSHGNEQGA